MTSTNVTQSSIHTSMLLHWHSKSQSSTGAAIAVQLENHVWNTTQEDLSDQMYNILRQRSMPCQIKGNDSTLSTAHRGQGVNCVAIYYRWHPDSEVRHHSGSIVRHMAVLRQAERNSHNTTSQEWAARKILCPLMFTQLCPRLQYWLFGRLQDTQD